MTRTHALHSPPAVAAAGVEVALDSPHAAVQRRGERGAQREGGHDLQQQGRPPDADAPDDGLAPRRRRCSCHAAVRVWCLLVGLECIRVFSVLVGPPSSNERTAAAFALDGLKTAGAAGPDPHMDRESGDRSTAMAGSIGTLLQAYGLVSDSGDTATPGLNEVEIA